MSGRKKFSGTVRDILVSIKRLLTYNITTIMFGALFLYMIITVVLYATSGHVTSYQVTVGPLTKNPVCTALALRTEEVVTAKKDGYVEYYATEGMQVRENGSVYSLSDSRQPQKTADADLTEEQLDQVRSSASQFSYAYNSNNFYDIYSYKYQVRGTILQAAQEQLDQKQSALQTSESADSEEEAENLEETAEDGEASDAEEPSEDTKSQSQAKKAGGQPIRLGDQEIYTAPDAGIVLYSADGYENKTADSLVEEDFDQMAYQNENLITDGKVQAGEPVYKLVTSENWTLMVPLTDQMAASLAGRESIQVKFVKDGESQNGSLNIVNIGSQKVARIDLVNGMTRYAGDRFLEVELVINTQSGLKIPVSSIVKKDFYTVPLDFLTYGDNTDSQGFLREVKKGDASSSEFVSATIYRRVDADGQEITEETSDTSGGLCYVDKGTLKKGDVLIKPDSGETFTVGKTDKLQGVYNINQGYAVFRQIDILDQNEEYCIVDQGTSYGLRAFDYIVRDGSSVSEEEILYSGSN